MLREFAQKTQNLIVCSTEKETSALFVPLCCRFVLATGIRVGHLANADPWGEIRFFDTDRDGHFDRWETHLDGVTMPVRVSTARDAGIRDLPSDCDQLREVYTKELLPEALKANGILIAAMRKMGDDQAPEKLAKP